MNPFDTLGLPPRYDIDLGELERRYRELQRTLHPDKHLGAAPGQRREVLGKAMEVNEAYRTLRDDQRRAEALLGIVSGEGARQGAERQEADPELLMEVMELRETLGEAKEARDLGAVRKLAARVQAERARVSEQLGAAFAALGDAPRADALARARALVGRLKYYRRFLDEVAVIEEEAELS